MSTASFSDLGALFAPSFFYNMQGVLKFPTEKKSAQALFKWSKSERVVAAAATITTISYQKRFWETLYYGSL